MIFPGWAVVAPEEEAMAELADPEPIREVLTIAVETPPLSTSELENSELAAKALPA